MILNFQTPADLEQFQNNQPAPAWIFHDLDQAKKYCEESGVNNEIFFDLKNNKQYKCINFLLEEL